ATPSTSPASTRASRASACGRELDLCRVSRVIASEAKQSPSHGDCFGLLRRPRNDAQYKGKKRRARSPASVLSAEPTSPSRGELAAATTRDLGGCNKRSPTAQPICRDTRGAATRSVA